MTNRIILAVAPLALLANAAAAGPLNPPGGPISSTYKTLTEVEPRTQLNSAETPGDADSVLRISGSGSYYLMSNLSGGSGRVAVEIDADNVTLDLNGYYIRGGTLDSIRVMPGRRQVVIRNGTLEGAGESGIDASGCTQVRVEGVAVDNTAGDGIVVGDFGMVLNCTARNCARGIVTGENSVVKGCTSTGNTSHGLDADQGSHVSQTAASSNSGRGIYHRGRGSIVECSALSNGLEGIRAENTTTVQNCSSAINTGRGIYLTLNANVRGCTVWQNQSDGIVVGNHSVVASCSSTNNTGVGIQATNNSSVTDCTSSSNTSHGIRVFGEAMVRGNNCASNGFSTGAGAGILASGDNSRIEENNCANNSTGIEVTSSGNFIVRNSCANNGSAGDNFVIAASNSLGTVLSVAGGGVSTSNSFANFEY